MLSKLSHTRDAQTLFAVLSQYELPQLCFGLTDTD